MGKMHKMHRRKIRRRVWDLKVQARGQRLPKGFCLAKCVERSVFKRPLDLTGVVIPTSYED